MIHIIYHKTLLSICICVDITQIFLSFRQHTSFLVYNALTFVSHSLYFNMLIAKTNAQIDEYVESVNFASLHFFIIRRIKTL